jgi:LysR family glycine cleavage system transcriptional activator
VQLVDLTRGEFDVGIRIGAGDWPGLHADFLLPSLFTPLCSPALRDRVRTPEDMVAMPRFGRERWWRAWFTAAGLPDVDLTAKAGVELDIEQHAVTAAIAGHGLAISSPLFFEQDAVAGRVLQPFDLVVRDQRDYWLTYPATNRSSDKIRAFRDWLLAQAAACCEGHQGAH